MFEHGKESGMLSLEELDPADYKIVNGAVRARESRQDALDAGGFFDDVGPYVMAATRLPYGDDEVCAAACDATRLWRATQSTGAVVGLASC